MRSLKPSPIFFITFTAIFLIIAVPIAQYIQELITKNFVNGPLKILADQGIVEAPTAIAIVGMFFWLYSTCIWKEWPFNLIHGIPYVAGRYKGELESSFDGAKHQFFLEIRQTLLSVHVCLFTERSSSYSLISDIGENGCRNKFLAYAYSNTPTTASTDLDMRAHGGFACLEIFDSGKRLDGYYYNNPRDRARHGKISCKFEESEIKGHY